MSERIRRLLINSALFGVAAVAGVIYGAEGPIDVALGIAALLAGARAVLGGLVIVAGWVTPGNPLIVNMVLAFVGAFCAALIEGGFTSRAAIFAAAYMGIRAAAGLLTTAADNPR